MNPNSNQSPAETIDYLNQIAPKPVRRMDIFQNKLVVFGSIAAIVLVFVIIVGSILSGGVNTSAQLAARLISTEAVVEDATSKIQSNQLLSYNSNLKIYLINTIRDITPILAKKSINVNNLSSNVTAPESNTNLLSVLEDARLNAVYDRTYAREMSYRLDTILVLMNQIYNNSNDNNLKTFLKNSYNNLVPTQKQFAEFNAADS